MIEITPEFIGFTLQTLGEVMIGFTAIKVHYRVWKEHKIDKHTFSEMRQEQVFGGIAIGLIIVGYFLQVLFK